MAQKFEGSLARKAPGRPRMDGELETWVIRLAQENRTWGYDWIAGALKHLGYTSRDQTVGNIPQAAWDSSGPRAQAPDQVAGLYPYEVYHQVVVNGLRLGADDAAAVEFLVQQGHIDVVEVVLPPTLPTWAQSLDAGEIEVIEVIVLGQQQAADWLLVDNEHAREAAR